jgi:hypothetical protein
LALPALEGNFLEIVCEHTAGDPMRPDVVWTHLSPCQIARQLARRGTPVCAATVGDLLRQHDLRRRQPAKSKSLGQVPGRDEQFENIARLKAEYLASPDPILSMDTKKKELLGEFFRAGRCYADGPNAVFDHDFPSHAEGRNCRHHIFKADLQRLANGLGLPIRVAHYPPYCSKYNPIEHRLFPHVTRAWSGIVFRSLAVVRAQLRRVWTKTGLRLTQAVLNKTYALKRQASRQFLKTYPIRFEQLLPEWNYTVVPTASYNSGSYF